MWLQLIVQPILDRDGDILLWWNNCTVHETLAVQNAIKAMKGLHTAPLPKNCTDILQVLDLVVNGPIKHHYRTTRAKRLYDYFQEFKSKVATDWSTMSRDDQNNIQFKPPVQTLPKALEDLINLFAKWNDDEHPEDKLKGVQSSFIATGCVPNLNEDNIEPGVDEVKKFESFVAASTDQRSKTLPITPKDVLTLSTASVSDEVDIVDNSDFLDALAALAEPDSDEDFCADEDDNEQEDVVDAKDRLSSFSVPGNGDNDGNGDGDGDDDAGASDSDDDNAGGGSGCVISGGGSGSISGGGSTITNSMSVLVANEDVLNIDQQNNKRGRKKGTKNRSRKEIEDEKVQKQEKADNKKKAKEDKQKK